MNKYARELEAEKTTFFHLDILRTFLSKLLFTLFYISTVVLSTIKRMLITCSLIYRLVDTEKTFDIMQYTDSLTMLFITK